MPSGSGEESLDVCRARGGGATQGADQGPDDPQVDTRTREFHPTGLRNPGNPGQAEDRGGRDEDSRRGMPSRRSLEPGGRCRFVIATPVPSPFGLWSRATSTVRRQIPDPPLPRSRGRGARSVDFFVFVFSSCFFKLVVDSIVMSM